jgi:lysophospholipid acyltransferase (LPLAT)-like uncharacterized protein
VARERPRWTFAVVGLLGAAMLRALRFTWRIRETPTRFAWARRAGCTGPPGAIYAIWHSRIMLAAATQAGSGVGVLISRHGDGEYIARVIERMGFTTVRGSTTRGGGRALLEIVRALAAGRDVALTPDGPKGPRLRVQQGCVVAAMKSGAPIIPIGLECSRARRLRSWDRFVVPWPFARVAVVAGEPIRVPPSLDEREIDEWRGRIETALGDASRRAAEMAGAPTETSDVDPRATRSARTV